MMRFNTRLRRLAALRGRQSSNDYQAKGEEEDSEDDDDEPPSLFSYALAATFLLMVALIGVAIYLAVR
jgi:hypothetical protein